MIPDIDRLSDKELKALIIALLGKITALEEKVQDDGRRFAPFQTDGLSGERDTKNSADNQRIRNLHVVSAPGMHGEDLRQPSLQYLPRFRIANLISELGQFRARRGV